MPRPIRRRYYDPGAQPRPPHRDATAPDAAPPPLLTRQLRRAITREIDASFERARDAAARRGWATPSNGDRFPEHTWRHYWRAMLEHDWQRAHGVAHPPRPVRPHMPGGGAVVAPAPIPPLPGGLR